jgi:hemoglobin
MKRVLAICLLALVFAPAALTVLAQTGGDSLYKRIGGYDAIAAVVDDFIPRLASDKQLTRFFGGTSNDSKKRLRMRVIELMCNATGGPCLYTGRAMKEAHAGLGITEADWKAASGHFAATLDKFKVPEKEKGELVALVEKLRPDIVEKSGP